MEFTKDYLEAIKCFDEAIKINPSNSELWYQKGSALYFLEKYDEAIICLDRAADINPSHIEALALSASFLNDVGRFNEAIAKCDRILEISKKDRLRDEVMIVAYIQKAIALHSLKRLYEAIRYYDSALGLMPNNDNAWYRKGLVHLDTHSYQEAIRCFDKAIEINPSKKEMWVGKAAAFYFMRNYDKVIECANQSGSREHMALALYEKGMEYYKSKVYDISLQYYSKAIGIRPNDATLWFARGLSLHSLGRYEEAVDSYDTALGIRPDDPENTIKLVAFDNNHDKDKWLKQLLWHNKGSCLMMLGRFQEAGPCYDKGNELSRDIFKEN